MSIPAYKVGSEINVVYQSAGATTGLTIQMDVFDETQTLATTATFGSSAMAELGGSGRYTDSFTPDAEGAWIVEMFDSVGGSGKVVKLYEIVAHDVNSVGDNIDLVKSQTDLLPTDPADQSLVEAAIDASEVTIIAEIDDLESPAMVG
jgi:hypothetical protein